ncbi:MAG: aminopeptidase P family protein [Verrucomicrobia bacterium]|nr:aminopeptidase P family protein [Verrucomicrobiota bacterium]MBV9274297.1 aminopeptidase P family protein [Verrucomicrobiota bacterium]
MPKKSTSRLIFASSELSPDMLYLTGFSVPDPFLYLERNGKKTILLSDLEIDRGRKEANVDEVASLSAVQRLLERRLKKKPAIEEIVTEFLRKRRVKQANVPAEFPLGLAQVLAKAGIKLTPVTGLFCEAREFKTNEELKRLQDAIRITEIGLERAYDILRAAEIKPGRKLIWTGKPLTSEILRAEIDSAILRAGGTPTNSIVAGGEQACDPHDRGSGPLKANSLIILDVFPRDSRTGFYGDLTRTVVRGKASTAQRKLWETVLEGQELALREITPNNSGEELQERVRTFFKDRGYPTEQRNGRWTGFFHGLGHGLGLEIHEAPRIAATKFKMGQVLTVEPGLYLPGVGGVRHEDDGVVTESGFKVLSKFPKLLEL